MQREQEKRLTNMRVATSFMADNSVRKVHSICRRGIRVALVGPGRAGPAMADFWVEPQPLDFWNLKKTFVKTPPSDFFIGSQFIELFLRQVRGSDARQLSKRQSYVCLTAVVLLFIPFPNSSQFVSEDARRCSSTLCSCDLDSGVLIVAVVQTARYRRSWSQAPETPGRITFFVIATGRSPPQVGSGRIAL